MSVSKRHSDYLTKLGNLLEMAEGFKNVDLIETCAVMKDQYVFATMMFIGHYYDDRDEITDEHDKQQARSTALQQHNADALPRYTQILLKLGMQTRLYDVECRLAAASLKESTTGVGGQQPRPIPIPRLDESQMLQVVIDKSHTCDCGTEMRIESKTSCMICDTCGSVQIMNGTIFDETQMTHLQGARTKHGSYNPSKHCMKWLENIQAIETDELPEKVLTEVRAAMRSSRIRPTMLTFPLVRELLHQTSNTKYNSHASLLMKCLTGVSPPILTHDERETVLNHFRRISVCFAQMKKGKKKKNTNYIPYFIYKILEIMLRDSPANRTRRDALLSCIHLQRQDTLINNDKTWQQICARLNFPYRPTRV